MATLVALDCRWLACRWRTLVAFGGVAAVLMCLVRLAVTHGSMTVIGRTEPDVILAIAPAGFLVPVAAALGAFLSLASAGWPVAQLTWFPNRGRVLAAKAVSAATAAAVLAAGASAAALLSYALARHVSAPAIYLVIGSTVAFAYWALLASLISTALNSRAGAALGVIGYWAVADPILTHLSRGLEHVMPGGAITALTGSNVDHMPVVVATVVLITWLLSLALIARARLLRRDLA